MTVLKYVIISLYVLLQKGAGFGTVSIIFCSTHRSQVGCPPGYLMHISRANYGRTNPHPCSDQFTSPGPCVNNNTLPVMVNRCYGESGCVITQEMQSQFGSCLLNVNPYLDFDFACVGANSIVKLCQGTLPAPVNFPQLGALVIYSSSSCDQTVSIGTGNAAVVHSVYHALTPQWKLVECHNRIRYDNRSVSVEGCTDVQDGHVLVGNFSVDAFPSAIMNYNGIALILRYKVIPIIDTCSTNMTSKQSGLVVKNSEDRCTMSIVPGTRTIYYATLPKTLTIASSLYQCGLDHLVLSGRAVESSTCSTAPASGVVHRETALTYHHKGNKLFMFQGVDSHNVLLCQYHIWNNTCHPGSVHIFLSAEYGRNEHFVCLPRTDFTSTCYQDRKNVIEKLCYGLTNCIIHAHEDYLDNPCPGVYKYLRFNYACIPANLIFPLCSSNSTLSRHGFLISPNYPHDVAVTSCTTTIGSASEMVQLGVINVKAGLSISACSGTVSISYSRLVTGCVSVGKELVRLQGPVDIKIELQAQSSVRVMLEYIIGNVDLTDAPLDTDLFPPATPHDNEIQSSDELFINNEATVAGPDKSNQIVIISITLAVLGVVVITILTVILLLHRKRTRIKSKQEARNAEITLQGLPQNGLVNVYAAPPETPSQSRRNPAPEPQVAPQASDDLNDQASGHNEIPQYAAVNKAAPQDDFNNHSEGYYNIGKTSPLNGNVVSNEGYYNLSYIPDPK